MVDPSLFEELRSIRIRADMDPMEQKRVLAKIDALGNKIVQLACEAKTTYETVDELLDLVLKSDFTDGKRGNDFTRKRASWEVAKAYNLDGDEVDLVIYKASARKDYNELRALLKALDDKQQRIALFCSLNKADINLGRV